MSPTSTDPAKKAKQLANLRKGGPPAAAGNQQAVRHGAYAAIAKSELEGKVAEIHDALTADAPVREADGSLPAADAPAVKMAAEALCRLDRISEYVERRGWEDESGKPRPVLEYESRLRSHSLDLLRELGMTPASRAKLGVDLQRGFDLAAQWQAEAEAEEAEHDGEVIDGEAIEDE